MRKNSKFFIFISLFVIITVLALSGCVQNNKKEIPPSDEPDTTLEDEVEDGDALEGNNNENDSNLNVNNTIGQRADKISKAIVNLPEIDTAPVIVNGNTAIVGITSNNLTNTEITPDLRKKIEDAIKNLDSQIQTVALTADNDLFTRIGDVSKNIREGNPATDFKNDIDDILSKIGL